MSSLNKAFIKAYHKSAAKSPPRSTVAAAESAVGADRSPLRDNATVPRRIDPPQAPESVRAVAESVTASPSDSLSAVTTFANETPQAASATPITVFDTGHVGVRAPHAKFAEPRPGGSAATPAQGTTPRAPGTAQSAPPAAPTGAAAAATPATAATVPPASASQTVVPLPPLDTLPINPRPVILPMTRSAPLWRPVFEVTNFVWPQLTDVLLDAAAVQFRAAAIDLGEACRRHRKLVVVTAARRGEGCTVVTLALAKALAEQQQRVILVDAHFDAPGLADRLGLATQVGWEDALSSGKPLTEALVESLEDRLIVLPLREPAPVDWRLSVARLKASFDEMRKHCDVVLVDAGPFGEAGDRRHLLSWAAGCRVDRALVVRDLRTTSDDEISEIDRQLHNCGIAQWNFVENFAAA